MNIIKNFLFFCFFLIIFVAFSSVLRGHGHEALESGWAGFFRYLWWITSQFCADAWRAMLYTWKLLGKAWEVWDGNDAQGIVSMIAFGIFVILIAKPGLTLPVKIFGCFATFAAFPFLWTGTLALINGFFYWLEHAKIVFEILVGVALTIGLMWAIGGHLDLSLPKGGGGGGGGHGGGHHH